jgi:hypothetical protein
MKTSRLKEQSMRKVLSSMPAGGHIPHATFPGACFAALHSSDEHQQPQLPYACHTVATLWFLLSVCLPVWLPVCLSHTSLALEGLSARPAQAAHTAPEAPSQSAGHVQAASTPSPSHHSPMVLRLLHPQTVPANLGLVSSSWLLTALTQRQGVPAE